MKILVSDHKLFVETGRYLKPPIPREERLCATCLGHGREAVEDEQHVLDHCLAFSELRDGFWSRVCSEHVDSSWRSKGVIELLASLGAMDLRIRRQIWHALAVFVRAIDLATFEREAAEEEEEEDELSE